MVSVAVVRSYFVFVRMPLTGTNWLHFGLSVNLVTMVGIVMVSSSVSKARHLAVPAGTRAQTKKLITSSKAWKQYKVWLAGMLEETCCSVTEPYLPH